MSCAKYHLGLSSICVIAVATVAWPTAAEATLPQGETMSLSCCPVGSSPPLTRISVNTGAAPWQVSGKYLYGGFAPSPTTGLFASVPPSPFSLRAQVTAPAASWTANLAPASWVQPFSGGTPGSASGRYLDGNGQYQVPVYNYTLKIKVGICSKLRSATFAGQFASDDDSHAFLDFGNPVSPAPITTPAGASPASFDTTRVRDFRSVATRAGTYVLRVPVYNSGGTTALTLRGDVALDCGKPLT